MKRKEITLRFRKLALVATLAFSTFFGTAQTNVYDDVIAVSPNHTSLAAAIQAAGLESALQNPAATLTVFAPTNDAIDDAVAALGISVADLLASPDLSSILLYHVLGTTALSTDVTNGLIVTPLNPANTIKLTLTGMGSVYANQAMVNAADLTADNGVVHSIDAVILPFETVVDVAIDNGFSSLATAVITAELLPALTNPFGTFTVFAPSNAAFDDVAAALGTDIAGLLALPNLADILTYHVLGSSVMAADINNGDIVTPLNTANTIKLTATSGGDVFANHAQVELADVMSQNGVVHAIDAVILPSETIVDIAIDNGFTTLTAAVIEAELLPALTNPLAEFTVFAPTNAAFDDLATALGTDLNGILALPNLADVLLYHVVSGTVLSTDLMNGMVPTLNGQDVTVALGASVMINNATVTTADVAADNGVVHIINRVLVPSTANINEVSESDVNIYPNPSNSYVNVNYSNGDFDKISIVSTDGRTVLQSTLNSNASRIDLQGIAPGQYIIRMEGNSSILTKNLLITSNE